MYQLSSTAGRNRLPQRNPKKLYISLRLGQIFLWKIAYKYSNVSGTSDKLRYTYFLGVTKNMSIFTDDVFISFSHQNNIDGWVTEFHDELNIQLNHLLDYKPGIWRDTRLTGADDFSKEIFDRLKTTKVFVSVLSPVYMTREWCKAELETFHETAIRSPYGLLIDNKSRILYAELTYVESENHPSLLANTLGYEFFERNEQSQRPRMYGHRPNEYKYEKFKESVYNLAGDIADILKLINRRATELEQQDSRPVVYLAETISGLKSKRDSVRSELAARGYLVVPPENVRLPDTSNVYIDEVNKYLENAKLSVHLIGEKYGLVHEDATHSIVELQNKCAEKYRRNGTLESLIWIPDEVDPEKIADSRQSTFLDYLLNDEEAQVNAAPSHNNFEKFKGILVERLQKIEKAPTPTEIKRIYIMCDQADYEPVNLVRKLLLTIGYEPFLPIGQSHHEKLLKSCDATLIYYGTSDIKWLNEMIWDLSDIIRFRKNSPFLCRGLFLADPNVDYETNCAKTMKYDNQSIETSLKPFIECLQRNAQANGGAQ